VSTAIIRSAVAAMNAGDVDGYLEHFAPTCQRWVAGFDTPLSLRDVEDNARQLVLAFHPLHLHEELLIAEGAFVCARWRLQGTQTGDFMGLPSQGSSIDVATCEIYELADDMVVTTWTYQDPGQLFRQLGPATHQEAT
jgi:predicted ester cyclase